MIDTSKCPVCGGKLDYTKDTIEGVVLESTDVCPECGYREEYAYGRTVIYLGDEVIVAHNNDSGEAVCAMGEHYRNTLAAQQSLLAGVGHA